MCMAWDMKLKSGQKLTILALADASNDEGFCYPGYERLMRKTGLAKASLAKNLKALEDLGVFTKESHAEIGRGRKVNTYQLHLETMKSMTCELIENKAKSSHPELMGENAKSSNREKFKNDPRKVQKQPLKSSTCEHEQSVRTVSKEQSVNTKAKSSQVELIGEDKFPDWLNIISWGEFEQHRKEIKKPLTDLARTKLFKTLSNLNHQEQDDCISKSIENCWAGLFPDKNSGSKRNGNQPFKTAMEKSADRLRESRDPVKAMEF